MQHMKITGIFLLAVMMNMMILGCGTNGSAAGGTSASASRISQNKDSAGEIHYAKDALNKAAYEGDTEKVAAILKTHPDPDARDSSGGTALHAAMFQKNIKVVQMLVDYGLDVNAIGPKNGYTPLHDAVWGNNPEAIRFLLSKGANPDIKNHDGLTPKEKAIQEGKTDLAEIFDQNKQ